MSGYTREMQVEDLTAISNAQSILSAMIVGEKPIDLQQDMHIYARIAGYNQGSHVKTVARVFWALCEHNKIDGFQLNAFELVLNKQRKLVKSRLIRRKRKLKTCAKLDEHRQKCFCLSLQKAQKASLDRESFSAVGHGADVIPS